ncbi:MAG: hypothetical protein AAFO89_05525 [Planctomycetota bacterium]
MRGMLLCGVVAIAGASQSQVDIKMVGAEGDAIPGTPYTISGIEDRQAVLTKGGFVVFGAWTSDLQGEQQLSTLVANTAGDLHVVARTGAQVPGMPAGIVFGTHGGVIPSVHYGGTTQNIGADQLVVSARFRDDAGAPAGGGWVAWDADQGAHVFLLDEQTVSISGRSRRIRLETGGFDHFNPHV